MLRVSWFGPCCHVYKNWHWLGGYDWIPVLKISSVEPSRRPILGAAPYFRCQNLGLICYYWFSNAALWLTSQSLPTCGFWALTSWKFKKWKWNRQYSQPDRLTGRWSWLESHKSRDSLRLVTHSSSTRRQLPSVRQSTNAVILRSFTTMVLDLWLKLPR